MDDHMLLDLEERISSLESKVLPHDGDNDKVLKTLKVVDETLTTFASRRERFNQIFKRVPSICEYLSPGFVDAISMDNTCETEAILAAEDAIKHMALQFEEIKKLEKSIESDKIKEISKHQPKLAKLQTVQHKQLGDLNNISEDLNALISTYNQLVNYISESFVKLDWTLSQLEEKSENET